jgi:hypothetical protein
LAFGLDAFGGDDHAERVGHVDGRGDDGIVGRAHAETGDEAGVDLELVERELAEVGERRAAGAEVVDRETHAQVLERAQRVVGGLEVVEQRDLGDLEAQSRGFEGVLLHAAADELRVVGAQQVAPRDVERDGRRRVGRRLRALRVRARLLEHPEPDGDDHPGLLGDFDEVDGHHEAAGGVRPAQEGFVAHGRAARELELPLEHDAQLVLRDRLAERALGEEPGDCLRVHRLVEQLPTRATATFGAVHRRVGVAQEP